MCRSRSKRTRRSGRNSIAETKKKLSFTERIRKGSFSVFICHSAPGRAPFSSGFSMARMTWGTALPAWTDRLHAARGGGLEGAEVVETDERRHAVEREPGERAAEHRGQAFAPVAAVALDAVHDAAKTHDRLSVVQSLAQQAAQRHRLVRLLLKDRDVAEAVRHVAVQHIRDPVERFAPVIRALPRRHGFRVLKHGGHEVEVGRPQTAAIQPRRLHLKQFYLFHFFSLRIFKVSKMSKMSGKTVRPKPHRMIQDYFCRCRFTAMRTMMPAISPMTAGISP